MRFAGEGGSAGGFGQKSLRPDGEKYFGRRKHGKIFRVALDYLVKEDLNLAANYGLRRAIGELGPAGFLFEQYVEIILQTYGYQTKRNVIMRGACVEHEVDVSAQKTARIIL